MRDLQRDLRSRISAIVGEQLAAQGKSNRVHALIAAWLDLLDGDDLLVLEPDVFSSLLCEGFAQAASRVNDHCLIVSMPYASGKGVMLTALLIVNDDMPYLVDSILMALSRQAVPVAAVMNAVLGAGTDGNGQTAGAGLADAKPESFVLCILNEELAPPVLSELARRLVMVANDATAVHRDAAAMDSMLGRTAKCVAVQGADGREVHDFLEWARTDGFVPLGYAYYTLNSASGTMECDESSRMGALRDGAHPVFSDSLKSIYSDVDSLLIRPEILSVVKADVAGTLHRDDPLNIVGVKVFNDAGSIIGEHCFVGLFTRIATATPLTRLPFVRGRVAEVLRLASVRDEGFCAEKFIDILESLPRSEVLEADVVWLAHVCSSVVSLYKHPRTRVFARRDVHGRQLNVLVYMPRERYSAMVASTLADALRKALGGNEVHSQSLLAGGPLARVHLNAKIDRYCVNIESQIERLLSQAQDGWHEQFAKLNNEMIDGPARIHMRQLCKVLPLHYIQSTTADMAFQDLTTLLRVRKSGQIAVSIETDSTGGTTVRLFSIGEILPLSHILPALQNAGVSINREQCFTISHIDGVDGYVTSLTVDASSAAKLRQAQTVEAARELFTSLFNGEAEDGRLNGLVIEGGLRTREVQLVRAYLSYWRQTGSKFSVRYMADTLRHRADLVRELVEGFVQRFDPSLPESQRAAAAERIAAIKTNLASVNHADTEEILAALVDLILATLRTNYFQNGQQGDKIIFKFDTSGLALVPEPRPYREIYVFARRFEGVHLRGGPVARGGLRWSDRMEDYRTEVLGLVKAQMVKNAVIVPAGSKGGFVCKQMPKDAVRETIAAEGEAVYRLFISSLLEVTDNRVRGEIIAPADTVRYDQDDPYLVVAADKGTATFSDIANSIAVKRGFWLGDAFASGGSNGYDHKKMGITAKGAFEAVKRHFYEMDHDMNTTPITMVGVGDMSGDVFGNGVLLSRQLKVLAAFDHRHIFLDPTPDVESSFAERARMFALPRSSWEDYDKRLISAGGGVFPRSARTIALSPQIRVALDIEEAILTPEELMHNIVKAPVDLFYNGGIGTYIKASTETHAQVKDRANDNIRVNGNELRCKVVSEGGNLGATQNGRIEFALAGGRIFNDAIDNSAGVDCSDHEVNVKIWLDTEVNADQLAEVDRNRILNDMTFDIEELVLRDNKLQTHLLVRELQAQADPKVVDSYASLIASLEAEGALSRELEQMPTDAELERRKTAGIGLTAPELAVVIANVKNRFKRMLSSLPLTELSWAESVLKPYFPAQLVATRQALTHPLANTILATVLANESVNRCGPLMIRDLAIEHQVEESEVVKAWGQSWSVLNLASIFDALDADALNVPRIVSIKVDARTRVLFKSVIEGVLSVPADHHRGSGAMEELTGLFAQPDMLKQLMHSQSDVDAYPSLPAALVQAWRSVDAIEALTSFLFAAVAVQRPAGMTLAQFLRVGMALRGQAGIDTLERGLKLAPHSKSQEQLRNYAIQALRRAQQRLLVHVLARSSDGSDTIDAVKMVSNEMGLVDHVPAIDLEHVILAAWTLSELSAKATPPGVQGREPRLANSLPLQYDEVW